MLDSYIFGLFFIVLNKLLCILDCFKKELKKGLVNRIIKRATEHIYSESRKP